MAGSRWVRLDVGYFRNPKILRLNPHARALHIALMCYCAEHLTDGDISTAAITSASLDAHIPIGSRSRARRELIDAGIIVERDGRLVLHDFLVMNPDLKRERFELQREAWRERQRRHRAGGPSHVTP